MKFIFLYSNWIETNTIIITFLLLLLKYEKSLFKERFFFLKVKLRLKIIHLNISE